MLKFVALVGLVFLAIGALTAASHRSTYETVVNTRISSAIDQMKAFVEHSRTLVQNSPADKAGVYARASDLKANAAKLFSMANTTIQAIAAQKPLRYKDARCFVFYDHFVSQLKNLEQQLDSCTRTVVDSAASNLSKAVKSVSDAIVELEKLKNRSASCADSECSEVSNTIARITGENVRSMKAARNRYQSALHNISGFNKCVQTSTGYDKFNDAKFIAVIAVVTCVK